MNAGRPSDFACAVLAGGRSRRMGRDKAFLTVSGERLIDRQVRLLRALSPAELVISGRAGVDYGFTDVPVVHDARAECGPLAGLEAIFAATRAPRVLVLAVDMPAMTAEFLQTLLDRSHVSGGVVPFSPRGWEPLAAVYPRNAVVHLTPILDAGTRALRDFVARCHEAGVIARFDVPALPVLTNWNHAEDVPSAP